MLKKIYTNTAFNIEIDYKVKAEGAFLGLTIIVYTSENNCVFSSINNREDSWYGKPMSIGKYKSSCKIPANFFNNGNFNVSLLLFGKGFSDALMSIEVFKIEILDGMFLRRDFLGKMEGVVRPDLVWSTKAIS